MNEELKPCPFCAGKAIFEVRDNNSNHLSVGFDFTIKCTDCKLTMPQTFNMKISLSENGDLNKLTDERKKAIKAWNRRAENERG